MEKALNVAKYILNKCTTDSEPISNLQLQKILYYLQLHSIKEGNQLFQDEIEAWQFGPVVKSVYYMYCGSGALKLTRNYNDVTFVPNDEEIDKIIEVKRKLDPWDLVNDTHADGKPWKFVYGEGEGNRVVIPKELMREIG